MQASSYQYILLRSTKFVILFEKILWRPTECFLISRKYCDGRHSTLCYGKLYSLGLQNTLYCVMEYYNSRQSTCYNCGNTLAADRVLPQIAQALWRPTKYFHEMMEYFDGRQSSLCYGMEYYNGRQSTCYICESTLTADRVFILDLQYHWGNFYSIILSLPNALICLNRCDEWDYDFGGFW